MIQQPDFEAWVGDDELHSFVLTNAPCALCSIDVTVHMVDGPSVARTCRVALLGAFPFEDAIRPVLAAGPERLVADLIVLDARLMGERSSLSGMMSSRCPSRSRRRGAPAARRQSAWLLLGMRGQNSVDVMS